MECGLGLPVVQQVPDRASGWEAHAGVGELVHIARAADDLGFAWITCSDHVAVPATYERAMGATWYEPATTLAYLAAVTTRVRLLTHVLVLPYRHPLITAKTYATLDALSGGRLVIGTGTGHLKPEFKSLGVDHRQRVAISEEYLRALATALETESSSFDGTFVRWRDMIISPRPVQKPRPPIWLGGNSGAVARRAALRADGWIPWEIGPDAFSENAREAVDARSASGISRPLSLIAPVRIERKATAGRVAEEIETWRRAGATACHLGFDHDDAAHLLERMAFFAEEVRPRLG